MMGLSEARDQIMEAREQIMEIKDDIIEFILNHEEYPTAKEVSEKYPCTDNNLIAFYELLIRGRIAYDGDSWMVIPKG